MSIQDKIDLLMSSQRYVLVPEEYSSFCEYDYIIVKEPSLEDRTFFSFLKEKHTKSAIRDGVPSSDEIFQQSKDSGYWGEFEEDVDKKADEHIEFLEDEFKAKSKFKSRQNIIKLQIEDAKAKKLYVQNKRNYIYTQSAEYLAHEFACIDLVRKYIYKPSGELLFSNDTDLINIKNNSPSFLFFLISECVSPEILNIKEIREIARSIEWRLIWSLSKEQLADLFGRRICDLAITHKLLIYWSRIYDSAFESPEPPDNEVINDDDQFDMWLASKDSVSTTSSKADQAQEHGAVINGEYIEECTCGAKGRNRGKGLGEKEMHANSCLFGTWKSYSDEEMRQKADKIYNKNSKGVMSIIQREQMVGSSQAGTEEQHLRDKKTRQLLGMETKIVPKGNR